MKLECSNETIDDNWVRDVPKVAFAFLPNNVPITGSNAGFPGLFGGIRYTYIVVGIRPTLNSLYIHINISKIIIFI